jgi:hypothetical protein
MAFKRGTPREDEIARRSLRKSKLKRNYGLTEEEFKCMLAALEGVCAICGRPESGTRKGKLRQLSVDHCHETKKIRGLLCSRCNPGIGYFNHDPILLERAAAYLRICFSDLWQAVVCQRR